MRAAHLERIGLAVPNGQAWLVRPQLDGNTTPSDVDLVLDFVGSNGLGADGTGFSRTLSGPDLARCGDENPR